MKISKKIICVLLAVLMLAAFAPMIFAVDECEHNSAYEIEICPEGNATKYFMLKEYGWKVEGIKTTGSFLFCPSCNSVGIIFHQSNGYVTACEWSSEEDFGCPLNFALKSYGIYAPNSCIHRNSTVLALTPTCKSMFIDYEKYIKILYPEMTDEEILESMDRYGKEVNNEKLYAREVLCFCHDCNKIFDETLQYDKEHELEIKDTITADEALTNEVLTSMGITKDELNAAINSCITPVGTHKYESGKCIYCEQAEPHEEETTAAPEEPTTKVEEPTTKTEEPTTKTEEPTTKANNTEKEKNSFLDDIVDFFKKVGDWLRDLFSFKLIRSLFK